MRTIDLDLITNLIIDAKYEDDMDLNSVNIHIDAKSELLTATVTFQLNELKTMSIESFLEKNLEGDGIEYNYSVVLCSAMSYILVINIMELP